MNFGSPFALVLLCAPGCSGQNDKIGHTYVEDSRDAPTRNDTTRNETTSPRANTRNDASTEGDTTPDSGALAPDNCPELSILFASLPSVDAGVVSIDAYTGEVFSSVQVEVLQWPGPDAPRWNPRMNQNRPIEEWDRSDIPAGACVIRLLNLAGSCYPPSGAQLVTRREPMDGAPQAIGWPRYDEINGAFERCPYAPGCERPELYALNQWFYLREQGPDLYFVWCSQTCGDAPNKATVLTLTPLSAPDRCGE